MRLQVVLKFALLVALSMVLDSAVTICGAATPKTYAVFVAAYNPGGGPVRGGVAGSLFFVSRQEAITAFHVLQPASFTPPAGFSKVRVWLVHEGEPAIEIHAGDLTSRADRDLTRVRIKQPIKKDYVFETDHARIATDVVSDGFRAETAGPKLAWINGEVEITSVPSLDRVTVRGRILRRARVDLKAADLKLVDSPGFELDYAPIVGMSGGPVVARGKVVAMNSFADPNSRRRTWALELLASPGFTDSPVSP